MLNEDVVTGMPLNEFFHFLTISRFGYSVLWMENLKHCTCLSFTSGRLISQSALCLYPQLEQTRNKERRRSALTTEGNS